MRMNNVTTKMEIVEGKLKVDMIAVCRTCHHRLEADKSVDIFAEGSTIASQLELCHLYSVSMNNKG